MKILDKAWTGYVKLVNEEDSEMGYNVSVGVTHMLVSTLRLTSSELKASAAKHLLYSEHSSARTS